MTRAGLPQSGLRARRRKRRAIYATLGVFTAFIVSAGIVFLSWAPFMRITSVAISGEHAVAASAIESVVEGELAGSYAHLFSRSNVLFYPKGAIEQELFAQFPTLASVSARAQGFHTVNVVVTERQPIALWCGAEIATSSDCFLMDKDGVVYAPAVIYSSGAYQQYYGAVGGKALPEQYLDSGQFYSLFNLVAAIETKVATDTVQTVYVDGNGDAHVQFGSGFTLLFNIGDDSGGILQRFTLALTAAPFLAHPLSSFEYLDLRFGDKLYYKLKN